jgi:pectate lyase
VLAFSLFTCVSLNGSSGAYLDDVVHVKNEAELKNAVTNAPNGISTTIVIDNDIFLTESLKIIGNKNITLTSNRASGFYKLLGV